MNCTIQGAGAWGTAFALHLDRCGHAVTLVPRRMEQALDIASGRENKSYLPGYPLPPSIQIGCELAPVLMETEVVCLACPSHALRTLLHELRGHFDAAWRLKLFVVMCKGLDFESFKTPSEIVREVFPEVACGVLSGPTFAGEVASSRPTAAVFAVDPGFKEARHYQEALSSRTFRAYRSGDVKGTELGGTLKNIYAIAAGLCEGLELGDNAKAALLTRSLNELVRLGVTLGGEPSTFYGLSGFGDLVATCSGRWSRNRGFGERIGRGECPETILAGQKTVVEGYRATHCMHALCREKSVEAPILSHVHAILYEKLDPRSALEGLMSRELKSE
ncbi:MAG: NAD(P)H-dependent glycerol-3-phosphate dehydrogenase [Opitutales bacterium]